MRSQSGGCVHKRENSMKLFPGLLLLTLFLFMISCSTGQHIRKQAPEFLAGDSVFANAHLGVSVYDPAAGKFIFSYQDDKYFVPASNTKIMSCYAGMKYLDSVLVGLKYVQLDTALVLIPTGDPTFLHRDFPKQPVADFIRGLQGKTYMATNHWYDQALGYGWSWDDYSDYYMAERSAFPVYSNLIRWFQEKGKKENPSYAGDTVDLFVYSEPEVNGKVSFGKVEKGAAFNVIRDRDKNDFTIYEGREQHAEIDIPYVTYGIETGLQLMKDSLRTTVLPLGGNLQKYWFDASKPVYSQELDSLLKPMMYNSDNFFADQILLMAGMKLTGELRTAKVIDTILKTDLSGFPDKPKWVDGSGLSRFNLFTPRDMIWVLDKMKKEFSWNRIMGIFPTGGKGTLRSYVGENGRLYAKTGTLTGVMALSGYVVTKKNRTLIFSVMVNNHTQPTRVIREKISSFLKYLIEHY